MIRQLAEFVSTHTVRGECGCGQCCDRGHSSDPTGHTIDLGFFTVGLHGSPDRETFIRLTNESREGEFDNVNPLDGREHGYLELGAWIGDQGLAMQYMGLGTLLGVFKLLTPELIGIKKENPRYMDLLGAGYLTVVAAPVPEVRA